MRAALKKITHYTLVTGLLLLATVAADIGVAGERVGSPACTVTTGTEPLLTSSTPSERPRDVGVSVQTEDVSINLVRVTLIDGPCAGEIERARSVIFNIRSGQGFQIGSDGRIRESERAARGLASRSVSSIEAPEIEGATFIQAEQANARRDAGGLVRRYFGLWRRGESWIVADFVKADDTPASPARQLLLSSVEIAGIGYLPAPDFNGGHLTIVQNINPERSRLLIYDTPPDVPR